MNKKTKHSIMTFIIYFIIFYIVLSPLAFFNLEYLITNIIVSFIFSFIGGLLNSIYVELRKLNGEKFKCLDEEDEKDELLKS